MSSSSRLAGICMLAVHTGPAVSVLGWRGTDVGSAKVSDLTGTWTPFANTRIGAVHGDALRTKDWSVSGQRWWVHSMVPESLRPGLGHLTAAVQRISCT